VVKAGAEVVMFGGKDADGRPRNDGVAYDPATDRWRGIAPAPFTPALLRPSGVAVGGSVVVSGFQCDRPGRDGDDIGSCGSGRSAVGVYRPGADAWRMVPAPPGGDDGALVTVFGARGGAAVVQVRGDRLWLLDPAADRWSPLPDPPLIGRYCLRGPDLVAIAATATARRRSAGRAVPPHR
jgi:hypothetical protein